MASLLDVLPPEIIYYCFGNVFQVHHIVVASQGSVVKLCKDWYRLSRQPRIWRSFIGEWFGPDFLEQEAAANEGNEEEVLLTSSALLQASTLAADSAGAGEEGIDSSTDASPTSSSDADTAARNVFMSKYKVLKQYQETVRRADAEYDEILGCSKSANTSWQHVALDQLNVSVSKRPVHQVDGEPRIALHSSGIINVPFDLAVALLRDAQHRERWDIVLDHSWSIVHIDQNTDITLLLYHSFDVCLLRHHRLAIEWRAEPTTVDTKGNGSERSNKRIAVRTYRQSEHSVPYTPMLRQATIDHAENVTHEDVAADEEGDDGPTFIQVWGSGFSIVELDEGRCIMTYSVQINPGVTHVPQANMMLDNLCRNRPLCIRRFEAYVLQYQRAHGNTKAAHKPVAAPAVPPQPQQPAPPHQEQNQDSDDDEEGEEDDEGTE